jgi:hypothetical protein
MFLGWRKANTDRAQKEKKKEKEKEKEKLLYCRNLDACAPPDPRDPCAAFCSGWLRSGSTSALLLAQPADHVVAGQDPSNPCHFKLSTF